MTRAEFDALLSAALDAMMEAAPPQATDDPAVLASAEDARAKVQLLEASAREFADAVDRDGKGLAYGEAVVLDGSSGVAVVSARDYAANPIYWQTVVGQAESITFGPDLLPYLQAVRAKVS